LRFCSVESPPAMKYSILKVHNQYQQPGGEDESVCGECDLLTRAGHRVIEYRRDNHEIDGYGLIQNISLGPRTVWAWDSCNQIRALLRAEKPDVAHFDNTFPLISPAAYYACREAGVPVVQTLRNYRLICPGTYLQRNGRVCEDCLGRPPWRGVLHGCYRDSRAATVAVALMLSAHRWLNTWNKMVDCYIALTEFARAKFVEAGLPAEKIIVKPNFVYSDQAASTLYSPVANHASQEGHALFVGRLSPEKGVGTLLAAWQRLVSRIPLRVVGDGPLRVELESYAHQHALNDVCFDGRLNSEQTLAAMKRSRFLVFPSEWYETFGRVAAEAFACGVPVIASRLGAMEEIVEDGRTGLHFTAGDPGDLAAKVDWAWTHPAELSAMGRAARAEYEAKYTPERNYNMLMKIYDRTLETYERSYSPKHFPLPIKGEECEGFFK
jgi:glycosyltransferase involved in cell wall biosynthesis